MQFSVREQELLTKWNNMHAALYGDNDHDITPAEEHCITKTANYETITTDTYHDARKLARLLKQTIKDKCRAKDMSRTTRIYACK